ncbi:hypothetical protein C8R47DRAFT_1075536 [Mycena vitilis]|nr:hypothetical protein C8R47DRAFT_1075536 [Mycena vitilis]
MPPALPKFGIIEAWSSLTDGILGEDYLPTRDSSSRDGSVFSYKHLNGELAATGSSRGRLCEYRGTVFGEVSGHSMHHRRTAACLSNWRPSLLLDPADKHLTTVKSKFSSTSWRLKDANRSDRRGAGLWSRKLVEVSAVPKLSKCVDHCRRLRKLTMYEVFFPPDPRQPLIDDMPVGTPIAVCVHFCRIDREKGDTVDRRVKEFLVNAAYGKDFVPTRDRSIPYGSMSTFKCCRREVRPTATSRGHLVPFACIVFGEVDFVQSEGLARLVRLKCPEGVSAQVADLYRAQVKNMACIINEDAADLTGAVVSSWISTLCAPTTYLPYIPGTFYVDFPCTVVPDLRLGTKIEVAVFMKRLDTRDISNTEDNYVRTYRKRNNYLADVTSKQFYTMTCRDFSVLSAADML